MKDLIFDQDGKIVVVASDRMTGAIVGTTRWSAAEVEQALDGGRLDLATSQSGSVSLGLAGIRVDSEGRSLLLLCDPLGEATSAPTFAHSRELTRESLESARLPGTPYLLELEEVIARRAGSTGEKSYTKSLLDKGAPKIGEKLREEADELARALADETRERVASEAADLLFHMLVGLRLRAVDWREVVAELARRAGVSGHEEKARRKVSDP